MSILKQENTYCGRWAWYNRLEGTIERFYCGHATCRRFECRRAFWTQRTTLISDLIREYGLNKFFTLTMSRDLNLELAWEEIGSVWNKFRTVIKRKYKGFLYCAVLEAHKDGYPHVHGFTNLFIPQEEYSAHFSSCGGGSYAWVETVDHEIEISEYVTKQIEVAKYVGKGNLCEGKRKAAYKSRTFWRSVGLKTKAEKSERKISDWVLIKENIFDFEGNLTYNIKNNEKGVHDGKS